MNIQTRIQKIEEFFGDYLCSEPAIKFLRYVADNKIPQGMYFTMEDIRGILSLENSDPEIIPTLNILVQSKYHILDIDVKNVDEELSYVFEVVAYD